MTRLIGPAMREAEQRVAALTSPEPIDDRRIAELLKSSVLFQACDRAVSTFSRSVDVSATRAVAQNIADYWRGLAWPRRRLLAGSTLLVAVGVHVGVILFEGPPPGWWWLIVPGLFAALGGLLVAAAAPGTREGVR